MKLLHTSDWHIGRTLYGRKRYEEFEAFLNWLSDTIQEQEIDTLLVAGDLFDTSTPSNRAQELYYRFLCRVSASSCRHVVLIAGNHDSPSFLNAPKELLRTLHVHVVGSASENPEDEVIVLSNEQGVPELIVCAVPYLRDRDIRTAEAGESLEDKDRKLIEGIRNHYAAVAAIAKHKRAESFAPAKSRRKKTKPDHNAPIPIIGMGHLFTAGGQTIDGDGVRDLYVGSLAHVSANIFPETFAYIALGHLHIPQVVNSSDAIRYSGSPIPMGFGEAKQQKSVCLIEFHETKAEISQINVPTFQRLERLRGDWDRLETEIGKLAAADSSAWLEIIYEGATLISDLRERLDASIKGSRLEILRVKNMRIIDRILSSAQDKETLDDLNVHDVFERCLSLHEVPEEQRPELHRAYQETIASFHDEDPLAE
jgi:exonuclease SbcD